MDKSIDALAVKAGIGKAWAKSELITGVTPGFRREEVPAELAEMPGEFA